MTTAQTETDHVDRAEGRATGWWSRPGRSIPADGEIVEGVASVDESAITGESAPVIREAGGDRSGVTGGTRVLSDRIVVRGHRRRRASFLDRMIALVEGAIRQKTPNEIALTIVLAAFSIIFLIVTATLYPMAWNAELYMADFIGTQDTVKSLGTDIPTLIALLVCLIPTTIGALLAAIGIAGMDRALRRQHDRQERQGRRGGRRRRHAAAGQDRHDHDRQPPGDPVRADGRLSGRRAGAAGRAGLAGRPDARRARASSNWCRPAAGGRSTVDGTCRTAARFVEFTAQTRMSGIDLPDGRAHPQGGRRHGRPATSSSRAAPCPTATRQQVDAVASEGATPLLVCEGNRIVGLVKLEDILKPGIRERFERLRRMGLRTVMVTGDNPLTAKAIADQAGVDDFIAQATPEAKLAYIRKEQAGGKLVAMMGDGTNDAPALAQADIGVAMNSGTQAAKEAGNMVDLDSDPTKLIEVVEIGKQLLMTRGALTTFSIANDLAKYFAIVPAMFAATLPWLKKFDIMGLHSATSAILSAVIFNAIIIPLLIPIALKGVTVPAGRGRRPAAAQPARSGAWAA